MNPDDLPTTTPFPGEADVASMIESGVQKIMADARATAQTPQGPFAGPGLVQSGNVIQGDQSGGGAGQQGAGEYMIVFKNRVLIKKRVVTVGADLPLQT